PVPQEGLERSLEQAGRLPMQNVANRAPQYHVAFAGLVGLAASVLIALIFWPMSKKGSLASPEEAQRQPQFALHRNEDAGPVDSLDSDAVMRPAPRALEATDMSARGGYQNRPAMPDMRNPRAMAQRQGQGPAGTGGAP